MRAVLVTPKHQIDDFDYEDPAAEVILMTKLGPPGSRVRLALKDCLWIYSKPMEYRNLEMYVRAGRQLKPVNAVAATIMLAYGYDNGNNNWIPVENAVFAGMRLPESKSAFYNPKDHQGVYPDDFAKISVIRKLVLDTEREHGVDLSDFRFWQKWDMFKSFPDLAEKLKTV
jgi:hypothetical protein